MSIFVVVIKQREGGSFLKIRPLSAIREGQSTSPQEIANSEKKMNLNIENLQQVISFVYKHKYLFFFFF